jgi:uncharacterized protein YnzC (UPF0291/DUF896 family)
MRTRGLRARLDRLTRSANRAAGQARDDACRFTVDPALAKALRDDYERLRVLSLKDSAPIKYGGPLSAAEMKEQDVLRAGYADRVSAIGCPSDYGSKEYYTDSVRLHALWLRRVSPPSCGGGILTDAEDAEEAQSRARTEAFDYSPEGLARERYTELICMEALCGLSTAEQKELESLRTRYPDTPDPNPPLDVDDLFKKRVMAWSAAVKKEQHRLAENRKVCRSVRKK